MKETNIKNDTSKKINSQSKAQTSIMDIYERYVPFYELIYENQKLLRVIKVYKVSLNDGRSFILKSVELENYADITQGLLKYFLGMIFEPFIRAILKFCASKTKLLKKNHSLKYWLNAQDHL